MQQGDGAFDFLAEEERASKHAKGRLDPGFNEQQMAVLEDTEMLVGQRDAEINNIGGHVVHSNRPGGVVLLGFGFEIDAPIAHFTGRRGGRGREGNGKGREVRDEKERVPSITLLGKMVAC